jgi:hypothetical protein
VVVTRLSTAPRAPPPSLVSAKARVGRWPRRSHPSGTTAAASTWRLGTLVSLRESAAEGAQPTWASPPARVLADTNWLLYTSPPPGWSPRDFQPFNTHAAVGSSVGTGRCRSVAEEAPPLQHDSHDKHKAGKHLGLTKRVAARSRTAWASPPARAGAHTALVATFTLRLQSPPPPPPPLPESRSHQTLNHLARVAAESSVGPGRCRLVAEKVLPLRRDSHGELKAGAPWSRCESRAVAR